jgi:hypothetical protein
MNDKTDLGPRFHPAPRGLRIAGMAVMGVIAAAAFALAFGYFVMLLWNWLMPPIFGLKVIGYWQAFGIMVLAKLIFAGVGGRRWHGGDWRKRRQAHDWGGSEKWRLWRDFWEQEGRQAFDRFAERQRKETSGEAPEETL